MKPIYRSAAGQRAVETNYRDILDRWPVPALQRTVDTAQGETFVLSCGPEDAPPTVLLHGAGTNSAMWMDDAVAWSQSRRLHLVDVIGEPGLSAPSRPALRSDAYARWLCDVLDSLAITRAAFVGASLGGWLAVNLASHHPARVERLALQAPGGIGRQKYGAVIASLLLMPFGDRGRRSALRIALGPQPVTGPFAEYMLLIQKHYRPRRDALPRFTDAQLRALTMPMLIVAGANDRMLDSRDTVRRIVRARPEAAVELIPDCGHAPRSDDAIRAFLGVTATPTGAESSP
ncbi:alpha/beta fold hydrolase [Mycobacterium deserti]|uniref:Alpha/beta fold hydrolase n=1 Tax=Mycobacterium deserti TaxID=2978347 RepID=A0ABT2M7B2_9MYCO|nr:alpha/beta fold hydrolase [Mycobacterium deserti]MCT7658158.1 alpha/beta fold hydrolase [Mycobacterium deserti]